MPAERVAMRVVREVLHLTFAGISKREVARRTGLASSTVRATIARFQSLGLTWPLPETVTDSELEAKLYKNAGKKQGHRRIAEPDWAILHREMKRKHVTLSILWDEYIEAHPDGYRYSRFCELYRSWEGKISVNDLLEILEERHGRRSTIVTSQLPVDKWHHVIGDPTYADAILDRIVHNAHRIDLTGDSLRRVREKPAKKD